MTVIPAEYNNLLIPQGATFSENLYLKDSAGDAIDLTNYTARMSLKKTYDDTTAVISLTTENGRITITGATGLVQLSITASDTAALANGVYVYDLELINASGEVDRYIQGTIRVSREVTT